MSTRQRIEALVRRWNMDGWGSGDLSAIDEVFATNHVFHFNESEPRIVHETTDEMKRRVIRFRAAIPDLQVTIDRLVVEDDQLAVQVTFEGTHTGPFDDIPPSGKHYRWTDMIIARIQDGKVQEASFSSKCSNVDVFRRLAGT